LSLLQHCLPYGARISSPGRMSLVAITWKSVCLLVSKCLWNQRRLTLIKGSP
jgi:hypothetical protein